MNATWTHRDDGFVIGLLTGACVAEPAWRSGSPHDWPQPFASECSIRQGTVASARPNNISTLAPMSVRRSTNSSGEPKAAEMTLPTRWRVRPTMLRDLPRPSTAGELSQVGRIPMQTDGLRPVAHFRDAVEPERTTSGLRHSEVRIKIRPDWSYIRDVNAKAF